MNKDDIKYMKRAIELAKMGEGTVSPNPMVGVVIVKDGVIVGEGYHKKAGTPHAEVNAVNSAKCDITGATVYSTLEPCSHYGRTPPCADLLVSKRVGRVVVGSDDPNPLVAGRGIQKMRDGGIEVTTQFMKEDCDSINEIFFHYITHKTPFVVMKTAMTLDGKIATVDGESKWITGEKAREDVQYLRHRLKGIMVGIGTVIADNPSLTCRMENGINPVRIIVDSSLRIPLDSTVLQNQDTNRTIVACITDDKERTDAVENTGALVLKCNEKNGRVDLNDLMKNLGELEIDSILLEGGAELNGSAVKEGIANKVVSYVAPKIVGGRNAKTPVGGDGITPLSDCLSLKNITVEQIGDDIKITGTVRR